MEDQPNTSPNALPNILLIQVDQLSAESLGVYGHPVVRTPALEALADRGVVFDRAYCNHPACVPSRCSMMTGRYPSTTGSYENFIHLDPRERALPHVLRDAGYQTALIGKNHAFSEVTAGPSDTSELDRAFDYVRLAGHGGMVQGYEHDERVIASVQWAREHCWNAPGGYGTNPHPAEVSGSYLLSDTAVRYLSDERDADRPFFLWLSFPDPHTPYQAAEPYASMYDPDDIPLPPVDDLSTKPERQVVASTMDAVDRTPPEHLRAMRAIHYGMTNAIDDGIAKVLARLDEMDLTDETLIVFTADHGDSMGSHGMFQKQNCFYDSVTRVPLLMAGPGLAAPPRTNNLVSLLDLMPTVLDLVGIEAPAGVEGRSLAPMLRGEPQEPAEYVVIESGSPGDPPTLAEIGDARPEGPWDESYFVWCANPRAWAGPGQCIRTDRWKLAVYANGDGELYDMRSDPAELDNRYTDPTLADTLAELKSKLGSLE
jgi:arylsulfatase